MTEAQQCKKIAQGCYAKITRMWVNHTISHLQIRPATIVPTPPTNNGLTPNGIQHWLILVHCRLSNCLQWKQNATHKSFDRSQWLEQCSQLLTFSVVAQKSEAGGGEVLPRFQQVTAVHNMHTIPIIITDRQTQTDRQRDRQNHTESHRITDANDRRYTHTTTIGVSNNNNNE